MSPLAVLLRILLCIALVLNGSVPMVHAAMPGEASQHAAATDHPADHGTAERATGEGGCHDSSPVDAPPSRAGDDGEGDCCGDSGDCRSACAQHCAVSIPGVAMLDLTLPPAAGPLPTKAATHPDPHLRDRIRPPIA